MDEIKTLSANVIELSPDGAQALTEFAYSDETFYIGWIDVPAPEKPHESEQAIQSAIETAVRDSVQGPNNEEDATLVTLDAGVVGSS